MIWSKTREDDSYLRCKYEALKDLEPCKNTKCRMHMDYEDELNCVFVSLQLNETLEPHEITERTKVRPSCQSKALSKFKQKFNVLHK